MKTFIIAEIGINHNGDMKICKKLIDVAKTSGCDAVKFQKRTLNKVYTEEQLLSHRDSPWGNTTYDQKKGLEFGLKEYKIIDSYCKKKKIIWFASAWDIESQKFLNKFKLKFNKIASAMIIDKKFLEFVAKQKKHTFISTGMSNMKNISDAVKIFKKRKCSFELMHCVSTYPMKDDTANLNMINVLKKKFKCNVGYSGHENGLVISIAASAFGLSSLERHITLDRTMYGSDQSASIEPNGLTTLISSVRKIEKALGNGKKVFLPEEKIISKKLRAHL
ncbi:N-acetylneuraminate synthase family protein [Candidatus Pelagibacter communis]|jgi:N-acetylneuraminate synthase|uniref:N-acetylneuraminate synthase family protein n=1 Tax=Pelagibacter ubique TaxID=198252 RepID=UPI0004049E5B|nr:N-acetylneuraminate synthase family protein [Candidatus Pelagibacter ubique]